MECQREQRRQKKRWQKVADGYILNLEQAERYTEKEHPTRHGQRHDFIARQYVPQRESNSGPRELVYTDWNGRERDAPT